MKFLKHFSGTAILIFALSNFLFAQATDTSRKAAAYGNGETTICGMLRGGNVQHVSEDAPIILFIKDSASQQKIQIVFPKNARKNFPYDPEKKLPDHYACITGKVTDQDGSSAIIISSDQQIKTEDETSEPK